MSKKATDQLVVGMDIGYGNIKMDWGDGDLAYPARVKPDWFGATESHKLNGMRASYDEVKVLVNGRYYWIGPDTHLYVPEPIVTDTYSDSPEYEAHVIGGLHYMFRKSGVIRRSIHKLVLGLPLSQFSLRRETLRQRYQGKRLSIPTPPSLEARYGPEIAVRLQNVEVVPQPVGSLVYWATREGSEEDLNGERANLVIDPGERTFDWYAARGTKPIYDESGAIPEGMASIIYRLANTMTRELGIHIDYYTASRGLRRNELALIGAGMIDMRPFHAKAKEFANEVTDQLKKRLVSTAFDNVVLTGGGLPLFEEAIRKCFPPDIVRVVAEPMMANARGFYQWGAAED